MKSRLLGLREGRDMADAARRIIRMWRQVVRENSAIGGTIKMVPEEISDGPWIIVLIGDKLSFVFLSLILRHHVILDTSPLGMRVPPVHFS